MLQIKVLQNSISCKNLTGRTSLSTPRVELGASKISHFLNTILYWNGEVGSLNPEGTFRLPTARSTYRMGYRTVLNID